jgi:hypothetical protein
VERDFPREGERDSKTQKGNRGKQITIQYVWHALACGCIRIKDEMEDWTRMLVRTSYRMGLVFFIIKNSLLHNAK